ncbi:nucleotide exchange factor GrpE [Marinicrinis lubricantis]|uniref:Protein GrpE n=1 Tax=Marinicrinis lubricantis TaxID=2086470 RepID=A0ABW1IV33_9BACL
MSDEKLNTSSEATYEEVETAAESSETVEHLNEQAEQAESDNNADASEAKESAGSEADQPAEQEGQIEELKKTIEEQQNRILRMQAEFDNFRRRTRQEKEEFAKYASVKLIEQLLPVLDNFERALDSSKNTQDFESLAKGIEMVFRQMSQVMDQEGLTPIHAVGQPFNPEVHEAVMKVQSDEHEEGIVVEELQRGYTLHGKVIRPSMVKVSE